MWNTSSRRAFLHSIAGCALAATAPKSRIRIGAQTNTWGAPIKTYDHLLEVLDALVKLGYEGFETNFMSLDAMAAKARQCRTAFESRHIQYVAPHASLKFLKTADPAAQVAEIRRIAGYSAAMGAKHLIASAGFARNETDGIAPHAMAQLLNQVGEACHGEGLRFCYHNHIPEFKGDPPLMDTLLAATDPKLVWLNYDVGNAYPLGPKPGDFSAAHFRRIAIYHIKDVKQEPGGKVVPTDLGAGAIDLQAVVDPVLKSDWRGWLVVEREAGYPKAAENPEALVAQCRAYLRKITGI
jgi:sugar phosphate isomerase/epimerase